MKSLVELKKELVNGKLNNLYVFYGEENLIRRIYYQKIAELQGSNYKFCEDVISLYSELEKRSLFAVKMVYIVYNDYDFLKQNKRNYDRLIKLSKNKTVILLFDKLENKEFINYFEDYITYFGNVTDDIAIKYVNKEINKQISKDLVEFVSFNSYNSYNNIREETNKLNHYLEINKINIVNEEDLKVLFNERKDIPDGKTISNWLVSNNRYELEYYYENIENQNILGVLPILYNTVIIAMYLKQFGKYDGSSVAYNAGEHWGRVKEVRSLKINYNFDQLLYIGYNINELNIDVRTGRMKSEHAWDYLLGVIL